MFPRIWLLCLLYACLNLSVGAEPLLDEQAGQVPVRGWLTPWPPELGKAHLKLEVEPGSAGAGLRAQDRVSVALDMPTTPRMKPILATLKRSGPHRFEGDVVLTMPGLWRLIWIVGTPSGEFRMVSTFQIGPGGSRPAPRAEELCAPTAPGELPPVTLQVVGGAARPGDNLVRFTAPPGKWTKVKVAAQMSGMPMVIAPRDAVSAPGGGYEVNLPLAMNGLWLVRVDCDGKVTPPLELVVTTPAQGGHSGILLVLAVCAGVPLLLVRRGAPFPSLALLLSTLIAGVFIEKYRPPAAAMGADMASPDMGMSRLQAPTPVLQAVVQRLSLSLQKQFAASVLPVSETLVAAPVGGIVTSLCPAGTSAERGVSLARVGERSLAAPSRQVVYRHLVAFGARVDVGAPILTLVDTRRVRVRARVPVAEAARVVRGQEVDVVGPESMASGRIVSVSATTEDEFYWAETEVDNSTPVAMSMGMSGAVLPPRKPGDDGGRPGRFSLGQEVAMRCVVARTPAVLCVPVESIKELDGKTHVFVIKPVAGLQVAELREVSVGLRNATHAELVSGVREGEIVVATTQEELHDGVVVTQGYWGAGLYRKLLLPDDAGHSL